MAQVFVGQRLYAYTTAGSMGVVADTHFIRCFWPRLETPTRIFAEGSSGILVQGPPNPINVLFPDDTVFPDVSTDAENIAIEAVIKAQGRKGLINLPPDMVDLYLRIYAEERQKLPPTATKIAGRDVFQLRKEEYFANITRETAAELCDGKISQGDAESTVVWVKSLPTGSKEYNLVDDAFVEKM